MTNPNRPQSFTMEERFQQMLNTCRSVRKMVPNCFIVVIEGSELTEEHKSLLVQCADITLFPNVPEFVNHPHNIGHGEHKLLEIGIDFLLSSPARAPLVVKLGARYVLTSEFDLSKHSRTLYNFKKKWDESIPSDVVITGLYSFPYDRLREFRAILIQSQIELSSAYTMVEHFLYRSIPSTHFLDTLCLEGQLSYNRKPFRV